MEEWDWDHTKDVLSSLNEMRERSELTDVVLEVEGRSFPCHRAVLACCSQYFHTMFTSGYAEAKQGHISIKDVTQDAMATILDYAYTGCLKTEADNVQAVMSAARLLQVDFVFAKASEYMKANLDVSNCADVFMYADMLGGRALLEASGRYMASRFHEVVLQPSFLQLSLAQLQSFLNRDDLVALSEDDVVQAVFKWVDFDQEDRQQHLPELCKSFRRLFISSETCRELESRCPSTSRECKLVYSTNTTSRLKQAGRETLIPLRGDFTGCAPCYDPVSGKVKSMDLPGTLSAFSIALTPDDDMYLAGGVSNDDGDLTMTERKREKAFFKYNHLLNTWDPKCAMTSPRVRCGLVYLHGYIYAVGGDKTKKAAERYDPSCDEWTSLPPIPYPVSTNLCAVALGNSIYVISKKGCYCYRASMNTWSKTADMILPLFSPQAVAYQGCIYCVDRGVYSTNIEIYNPSDGLWERSGNEIVHHQCEDMILMVYEGLLYFLVLLREKERVYHEAYYYHTPLTRRKIVVYRYQPETKSWLKVDWRSRGEPGALLGTSLRHVAPVADYWLVYKCRTDFVLARLIPSCLGDAPEVYSDDEPDDDSDDTSYSDSLNLYIDSSDVDNTDE